VLRVEPVPTKRIQPIQKLVRVFDHHFTQKLTIRSVNHIVDKINRPSTPAIFPPLGTDPIQTLDPSVAVADPPHMADGNALPRVIESAMGNDDVA
jgi:hypothetical protein